MLRRPASGGEPAHCPMCRRRVLVERPKSGNQGQCPQCGSIIWLTDSKPDTDLIVMVAGKVVEPMAFDARQWSQASLRVRGAMAADLISTRRLMNKPPETVLELLGRPGGQSGRSIWYGVDLGRREEFRGVGYRLRINFNAEERVDLVEIEEHRLR